MAKASPNRPLRSHRGTRIWVVAQHHPLANDDRTGTREFPFKTISRAAELAEPGDTVLVHEGVYRERVAPARGGEEERPIIYAAAPGETVVIKGSDVWRPEWQSVPEHPHIYRGQLNPQIFPGIDPYRIALKAAPISGMTLGQVFVDGKPFLEVGDRENLIALPETWMFSSVSNEIWVHLDPLSKPLKQRIVELTVRERNFAPYKRGLGYITVRGFRMEHCANQLPINFWSSNSPQAGALSCRGGHHWAIENNTIRLAKTVAIDCGSEGKHDADGLGQAEPKNAGHHLIRNNVIADNGAAGIIGIRSSGTKIVGNAIERNASLGLDGSETAGIKVHCFIGGLIAGNLIRNNGASGIWLDNVWYDSRVTRNVILNNNGAGLFIEMGIGPLSVDNNIIALNTAMRTLPGDGVYSHDSSGVTLAHNLIFFNANFGVWSHIGTERNVRTRDGSKKLVEASGWRVLNNMIIGNHRGAISLPARTERSKDNISDYNLIAAAYDWITAETYGKELDKPIFIYNTNKGRVTLETLWNEFQQALDRATVPQSARPNLAEWMERPILTFEEWKLLTNNDRHSLIPKIIRPDLSVSVPFVKFAIDDSPSKLNCKAIVGIEIDFFGNPIPTDKVNPGPFQQLKFEPDLQDRSHTTRYQGPYGDLKVNKNLNTFLLWPIPDGRLV
jgi:Right handed beta helix region/Protein of unknown function (DUF1565)